MTPSSKAEIVNAAVPLVSESDNMHRNVFQFLAIFLISLTVSAQDRPALHVGVVLPLTGPVAEYGVATKNGIELARLEHPQQLQGIEFHYEDSQYEGSKALSAYQKLKSSDGASVIYVWGYGPSQAVIPVSEKDKFPVIAVTAERSISLNRKYSVRFCYHIETVAEALLAALRKQNIKKIGIVKAELAYMNGLLEHMQKNLLPGESAEIVDNYQLGENDFKSSISKLKSKKFDAVGIFLVSGQIAQFYRQARQLGLNEKTFGTDFFDSIKEVRDAKGAMTGAVFAAPYADSDFVKNYVNTHGNDYQVAWAANGYEFAVLTAKLFGNSPDTINPDDVINRYKSSTDTQGTATTFKFNESAEGSGFDFKVVARKVEQDSIVDLP